MIPAWARKLFVTKHPEKLYLRFLSGNLIIYNRSIEKYPSSTSSMGSTKAVLVEWPEHVTRHLIHLLTKVDRLTDHPAVHRYYLYLTGDHIWVSQAPWPAHFITYSNYIDNYYKIIFNIQPALYNSPHITLD